MSSLTKNNQKGKNDRLLENFEDKDSLVAKDFDNNKNKLNNDDSFNLLNESDLADILDNWSIVIMFKQGM